MPLDAICLGAVAHEIRTALTGGKIDKIHQPGRDEVVLAVRGAAGSCKLLLSANPGHPRVQLTDITRENPDKPPMFCMLLRKHLSGARILAVTQPSMERVLILELEALDSLGDRVERRLVLEAMGRHSNLILLDEEGRIVDCLRRVDSDMSVRRQVLPGLFYHLPPQQEKYDPTTLDRAGLEALLAAAPEESQADKWLLDTFGGISPLISREIVFRASGATDTRLHLMGEEGRARMLDGLEQLLLAVRENNFTPTVVYRDGKPSDYTFMDIGQYEGRGESRSCKSFGTMLDDFYAAREIGERVRQQGQDMLRTLTNARDRTQRKIALQEQELAATLDRELLRQKGDIITSNLHAMSKGMCVLRAVNYYDPEGAEIDIQLDVLLTPQQNAAKYYKEYNKAKTAEFMLTQQLEKGRRELDYLNSVLDSVSRAEGERDLREIRQELAASGYLRRASKAAKRDKKIDSKPMEFMSSTGLAISVGRNNTQNDYLTCKLAAKGDIWLHTQKIHGSHVILWTRGEQPDLTSLNEAACLAAWFSQGREGGKVPVDYTPVKYVKKPAGALPGMVVYTTYETAWVTPDETLVKRLRVK